MNESIDVWEKQMQELVELNTMLARNHLLLEQDFIECLDLLEGMVVQSCSVESTDGVTIKTCLDSMCLHSFADALRYLNSKGRVVVTSDVGRRVIAMLKTDDTDKEVCLHPAPGKCCPEASCDYSYHKEKGRTTCSICGKSCKGCKLEVV